MNDKSGQKNIRREASARRTQRTTFRLRKNDHELISLLADWYQLTEKDFLDMIVQTEISIALQDTVSDDSAGTDLPQGIRKTYVVTSKVIANLDAGAKTVGCSRDIYLTLLVRLLAVSLRREVQDEMTKCREAIALIETALSPEFRELIAKADRVTEDIDLPSGDEPSTVLSMFDDCTIPKYEEHVRTCQEIVERLDLLMNSDTSELGDNLDMNASEEVQS